MTYLQRFHVLNFERSFAWMEINKTLATLFRLFEFERTVEKPSSVREGFFLKIAECVVKIKLKDCSGLTSGACSDRKIPDSGLEINCVENTTKAGRPIRME